MEYNQSEIRDLAYSSQDQIRTTWPELVNSEDAQRFIDFEKNVGPYSHYKHFSENGQKIFSSIQAKHGKDGAQAFMRIVLLKGITRLIEKNEIDLFPSIIQKNQLKHLHRIAQESETKSEWLEISEDLFQKEFGLVSNRLFAAGAQLIDVRCGIPRSILFKHGLLGIPKLTSLFARLGGFKPYFQIHTHKFNLDQFNEAGWEETYRGCAALYEVFGEALGMFGGSWFYDPAIKEISPRLSYLQDTPIQGGANAIYFGIDAGSTSNALATSASRRELYEQGKYTPKSYMLIWGKKEQIAWARKNKR